MSDTYTVTGSTIEQSMVSDPMGKPLGKQAAIVLAYTICQYTHDTVGIIKNEEAVIYLVDFDEMLHKPYLIPMADKEVSAYIKQHGEAYSVSFQGYLDVREYVNLHDGLDWNKDAFQKYHRAVVQVDNKIALDGFIDFLRKANVNIELKDIHWKY